MSDNNDNRGQYGMWVVLSGLVSLILVFLIASWRFPDIKDATAAIGAVTGTIGTLVGAFFGFHAGANGKEKIEQQRQEAEQKVERLAGALPQEEYMRALGYK